MRCAAQEMTMIPLEVLIPQLFPLEVLIPQVFLLVQDGILTIGLHDDGGSVG